MLNLSRFKLVCFVMFASLSAVVSGHEDMDIGIESVVLDKQCYAQITLRNTGRDLPDGFYQTVNPAYLTITKGPAEEQLPSLRALDRNKVLQKTGGVLKVKSRQIYANIPEYMQIDFTAQGEFLDYGAANNQLLASLDCRPGDGQVSGLPIQYHQPDVAVLSAAIDVNSCILSVTFSNLTGVALADTAWGEADGVSVVQMNVDIHERVAAQSLASLDKDKVFTRGQDTLNWTSPLAKTTANIWRVGIWRVPEDRNFQNNQVDLVVPEQCREH